MSYYTNLYESVSIPCVLLATLSLVICFADDFFSAGVIIGLILAAAVPVVCIGVCGIIIVIVVRRRRGRNVSATATTIPSATAAAAATYTAPASAPPPYPGSPQDYSTQPQGSAPTGGAYPQQQQPPAYPDEPQKAKVEMQEYQADPVLDYPPQS
jgi:hypothetical protein